MKIAKEELENIKKAREEDCVKKNELKKLLDSLKDTTNNNQSFKDYLKKQLNLKSDINDVTIDHIRELNQKNFNYLNLIPTGRLDKNDLSNIAYEKTTEIALKIESDEKKLHEPFLLALSENRGDFVNLFLESGKDIKKFMNAERLGLMYYDKEVFISLL